MVLRRKNLLDALRQAQRPDAAPPPPPAPARAVEPPRASESVRPADAMRGVDPRPVAAPIAPAPTPLERPARSVASTEPSTASAPREATPASELRLPPTSSAPRGASGPSRPLLLGALALAVVVLAWVLWRKSASGDPSEVAAAGGPSDAASAPGADLQTPRYGYTRHDEAFLDKKNRFTVQVATYDNDEKGLAAARGAYAYLDDEGVPAIQPIRSGDGRHLVLCVGYDPEKSALTPMLQHVAKLRGPKATKKLPFEGAYVVSIDDVVRR